MDEMTEQTQAPEVHPIEAVSWNGEAPFSDNFYYVDRYGFNHQMTVRAATGKELLTRVEFMTKFLSENGRTPKPVGQQPPATFKGEGEPTGNGGAHLPPAPGAPPPVPAPGAPAPVKGETFQAVKMEVTPKPDGKAELKFYAAGHRYPDLTSTQTVERLLQYLAATGDAWTAEHLATAQTFDVSYAVAWEPSEKLNSAGKPYKNLVAVKA
jgi:hypothetical protein